MSTVSLTLTAVTMPAPATTEPVRRTAASSPGSRPGWAALLGFLGWLGACSVRCCRSCR